jgi:signal transduction histidine kinase
VVRSVKTAKAIPLRLALPLFLLLAAIVLMAYTAWDQVKRADAGVEQDAITGLTHDMTLAQGVMENLLRKGDIEGLQACVADIGAHPETELALLVDQRGRVLNSNESRLVGRPVSEVVPDLDRAVWQGALRSMRGTVFLSPKRDGISGVYPVMLDAQLGGETPRHAGVFYERRDLLGPKAVRRHEIRKLLAHTGAFYLGSFLVLGAFLHFAVTKRAAALVSVMGRFTSGDRTARSTIRGGDELACIGGAFDRMADTIDRMLVEQEALNEELDRRNREMQQIVYVASHDLRSPLVNVQGFGRELVQECREVTRSIENAPDLPAVRTATLPLLQEEIPRSLEFIQGSIARMDSLLGGLLRLSRLGRTSLTIQRLDVNAVVASLVSGFEYVLHEKGAEVRTEDLPDCQGDSVQVSQVFANLLDNAIKYLDPSRSGRIRISGQSEDGRAVYCVEDNGIGIAARHQKKIFEIFHRLSPGTGSGEGIGLNIVTKILERQDGKVWVESEPGVGSRFFVSMPGAVQGRG